MSSNRLVFLLTLSTIVLPAMGADTVETWDLGATNLDYYMGADGLGRPSGDGEVFGDIMLGYGLAERFSAYLGASLLADRSLGDGHHHTYLGIFGTVHDRDHVDLDVFMDMSGGQGGLALTPSIELNFDRDAEQQSWGLFLRAGVELGNCGDDDECDEGSIKADFAVNPGAYLTLGNGSQLVIEYDSTYASNRAASGHDWEYGAVALGWNVPVTSSIELINELHFDVPQDDEPMSWGVMVGFIATLPAGPR